MPVWDDHSDRDPTRAPGAEGLPRREHTPGADLARAHEDVRVAARKDAADVLARARRDIRQIVADARREIQEISAQVRAAEIQMAESSLPDPSALEVEELPVLEVEAWMAASPASAQRAAADAEPSESSHALAPVPSSARYQVEPSPAKTFVALFALAGVVVLTGTVWWLGRLPESPTSADSLSTAPPEATPAINPAAALTPPERPAPALNPDGLLVELEVQRNTWIRTTVDGDADGGRLYDGGEVIKLEATRDVVVRAGDAGGVLVSVDGGTGRPFGPDGQALTRRFSRQPTAVAATERAERQTPAPTDVAQVAPAARQAPLPAPAVPAPVTPPPVSQPSMSAAAPILPGPPVPGGAAPQTARTEPPQAPPPPVTAQGTTVPAGTARGVAPARVDIAASGRQWIDAYHRQDRASMQVFSAPSLSINDERRPDQRFPFGLEITRAFDDEQLSLSGDNAIFNARMIERASTGAITTRVSQTWIRRLGQWQLQEARFLPDSGAVAGR